MSHKSIRSNPRPRLSTQVGALGLVVVSSLSGLTVIAQPAVPPPAPAPRGYAVAEATTEHATELAPLSIAERTRRAEVVARAGDATLTVGEIEHYLAHSPRAEHAQFRTPEGRARIVRDLLRVHLLARAAEARGAVSDATRFAAQRAEELVLAGLYTEDLRRQTALTMRAQAPQPVAQQSGEQRYGVVFRGTRAAAQQWTQRIADLPADAALRLAQELGEGVETPWAERAQTPLPPAERDALFALSESSAVSAPIPLAGGRVAVVMLASIQGAIDNAIGPEAQIYLESERVRQEQVEALRAAHVTNYDSARVDGVLFRLPDELSIPAMQAIETELNQTAAEIAAAAEAAEAPHPVTPSETP